MSFKFISKCASLSPSCAIYCMMIDLIVEYINITWVFNDGNKNMFLCVVDDITVTSLYKRHKQFSDIRFTCVTYLFHSVAHFTRSPIRVGGTSCKHKTSLLKKKSLLQFLFLFIKFHWKYSEHESHSITFIFIPNTQFHCFYQASYKKHH